MLTLYLFTVYGIYVISPGNKKATNQAVHIVKTYRLLH